MVIVTPATFPVEILSRFRGQVIDSRPAYPEVLHLKVEDPQGGEWWFSTHEAGWSPADPGAHLGKTIVGSDLDDRTGDLTLTFADDSRLTVSPDHEGADDDLEAWELFTPERTVLTYGPKRQWSLGLSDDLP